MVQAVVGQISNLSDESYQFPGRMQKEGKTQVATATKRPSQLFLQNIRQTQFDLEAVTKHFEQDRKDISSAQNFQRQSQPRGKIQGLFFFAVVFLAFVPGFRLFCVWQNAGAQLRKLRPIFVINSWECRSSPLHLMLSRNISRWTTKKRSP